MTRPTPPTREEHAWAAHKALVEAEARELSLKVNPVWRCMRMDAYEGFAQAYVEAKG